MTITAARVRWLPLLVIAAVAGGAALVFAGLLRIGSPFDLPWTPPGGLRVATTIAAIAVAIPIVAAALRVSSLPAAAMVAIVALTMVGAAWSLVVIAVIAVASLLVGRRMRAWWRDDADDPLIDLVLGAGLFASTVGILAHWPVNHVALYALLLALPILRDPHGALAVLRRWLPVRGHARTPSPLSSWLACTLGVLYAVVSLLPELGWDALAMHLFIPGHVAAHREWNFDVERFAWALMPALGDWLFTIAYLFDGERGARVLNAGCLLLVAALIHRLAVQAGASRAWGWFAAALWLSTPVAFTVGSSVFIDAEWTMFMIAGVVALVRAPVFGRPPRAWITAGALLGFAAAAKAVTLPMLAPIALLALWTQKDALRARATLVVVGAAALAFIAAAAKPYATAWWLTGNPVYPFYVHVFGGPAFDYWSVGPTRFREPLAWTTLHDLIFAPDRYIEGGTGAPGYQWLLLLPAAVVALAASAHRRGLALLVAGIAAFAVVFVFQSYVRYVLPAFALLIAALAVSGTTAARDRLAHAAMIAGSALAIVLNVTYLNAAAHYAGFPVEAVASAKARQEHIAGALPIQRAIELAVRLPVGGARLALFSVPAFALAPANDVVHPSWYTPPFQRDVRQARSAEELAHTLLDWKVRYVVTDEWWKQPEARRFIELATTPVAEFPGASVREVRNEFVFETEFLRNGAFDAAEGWLFTRGAVHDAARGVAVVSAEAPAYQPVPVRAGAVYRNAVRARCDVPGSARMQVNWLDTAEKFIGTSLQVFACESAWIERSQEVAAPPGATIAIVYASGATASPVEFDTISFRGRKR